MLTGRDRRTVKQSAQGLEFKTGHHNAKLYPSDKLLAAIYLGDVSKTGEPLTYSEALRRLAIQKEAKLKQDIEIQRGKYIPADKVSEMFVNWLAEMRRLVLDLEGIRVTRKDVTGMIYRLRDFVVTVSSPGARVDMRRRGGEDELEEIADHIRFTEKQILKDRWHSACTAAGDNLRQAYLQSQTDRSEQSLAALESARAEYAAALNRDPDPPLLYAPEDEDAEQE